MTNLAAWVSQSGGGLMLTGGKDSYGPGGYYKSPLAPIMPVSMELRREHRKLSLAIVVALDRSGSMACPVPGGRAKIDLADLATAEVVNMLGPTDQFGCLAVDSIPHEIVPLSDVVDKGAMRSKILRIDSAGGGIFIYEALAAAAQMILPAKSGTKHIILFSDAADAEEPGDYKPLVAKCVKAGITISVVGLGTEKDCDAELLKDIARRGGGQCMFTNVAQELPRLFAQDTFLDRPKRVLGRAGRRSPHGRADFDHPAAAGRFSQDRRIQSVLSSARARTWASFPWTSTRRRCSVRGRPAWEGCCAIRARRTENTPARSPAGKTPATSSPRSPAGRRESPRGSAKASSPRKNSETGSAASNCTSTRDRRQLPSLACRSLPPFRPAPARWRQPRRSR